MRKLWILVGLLGLGLAIGCNNMLQAEGKNHEKEERDEATKVKFDQIPAVVQQTFSKESNNAKIETVDVEDEDGVKTYEADVILDGTNWEIKVAADGKLISKKIDKEEGEEHEKDKKKEDKD